MISWRMLSLSCSVALGLGLAVGAPAQQSTTPDTSSQPAASGDLGEIVVSAQRRQERLVDVPISVTNISSDQLTDAGITDLAGVMQLAPDVRFDAQGPFTQGTIRGVGSSVVTTGSGTNVGIYVDGFFVPNPQAADQQLLSIDSVDILKGPQGTLFGRNTTAGAILVSTAKPSQQTNAIVDASYGSFNTQREQAYFTTGLTDKIAVDVGGMFSKSDNYFTNIVNGDKDVGAYTNYLVRTGLKIDVSDAISVLFRYEYEHVNDPTQEEDNALVVNGQPITLQAVIPGAIVATKPGQVANPSPDFAGFRSDNNVFQLTPTFDLGFGTLTSLSQYRRESSFFGQNGIVGSLPLEGVRVPVRDTTITQEFLLTSKPGSALQWTGGLYYFRYTDQFRADVSISAAPLFQAAGSNTDTQSFAGYVDGTYNFLKDWYFTAGLRYTRDEVSDGYYLAPLTGARVYAPTLTGDKVTPRAVLRYTPTDSSSVYASYTQGYKAGIYNLGGDSLAPVEPESISAYEVGYKYAKQAFAFDLATFYYKYKDLQVPSYGIGPDNVPIAIISNAANSRIYGLEADARYAVVESFELTASAAYLNARYSNFPNAPGNDPCFTSPAVCGAAYGTAPPVTVNASGFQMQRAPDYTGSLGGKYSVMVAGGRLSLSANFYYTASFFEDSAHEVRQPGYGTLGLRSEWTDPSGRLTLAVYGDNVTGRRYFLQAYPESEGYISTWSSPALVFGEIKYKIH